MPSIQWKTHFIRRLAIKVLSKLSKKLVNLFWLYCILRATGCDQGSEIPVTNGYCSSSQGDSGGPLVCEQPGGQWTLFGLTSWGSICFSKVLGPGVYSNVSYFVGWIEKQIYIQTFLPRKPKADQSPLPAAQRENGRAWDELPVEAGRSHFIWTGSSKWTGNFSLLQTNFIQFSPQRFC